MGYPNYAQAEMGQNLARLSEWIDRHNADRDPEAQLWGRTAKVSEEHGEVIEALISYTGQNPRKPRDPEARGKVIKELLDVAVTALGAVEHMQGNDGQSIAMLQIHLETLIERAGL